MSTHRHPAPSLEALEEAVTRRPRSLFADDVAAERDALDAAIRGRRVLVVGGGGSIGAATVRLAADLRPAALHVVDQNENSLAELVRDLRGSPEGIAPAIDFRTLPIDYGSPIMRRFLADAPPYDAVLNFAALKHVRSEKDVYSTLQMLDTNIVKHARFKRWLAEGRHGARYFAVSTDKAADPVGLMGASKRLMEDVAFGVPASLPGAAPFGAAPFGAATSARFANVAFSNGSLLQGFRHRLERMQPLAVPRDARRYFVSHREAGELCLLAASACPAGHVAFPRMDPGSELQPLDDVARRFLAAHGFEAAPCADEAEARATVRDAAARGRWPLLLTPLDTAGEKPYEEFVGEGESAVEIGLRAVLALPHRPSRAIPGGLLDRIAALVEDPAAPADKAAIVAIVEAALANFRHRGGTKSLDERL